jgi:hypothetical protein
VCSSDLRVGSFDADPRVFRHWVYRELNADLAAYPDSELAAHWILHGLGEGRRASIDYFVGDYRARYPDVAQAFGTNAAATKHFVMRAAAEGRSGSVLTDPLVYDVAWYVGNQPDLTPLRQDAQTLGVHWLLHGVAEGRQAHSAFSSVHYRARYADVAAAYAPGDWAGVIRHFVLVGHAQGRDGR